MWWHEQTWPTIAGLDKKTPVVIPLGSIEQHGHHLPVYVDSFQVQAVAERVERAMSDRVLMLPVQWLGCSHHHKDFPGTVSLLPELYSQVIQSIARCILRAGFTRIFFLNGHGGNQVPAAQALTQLVAECDKADAAMLAFASWWAVGREALKPEKHGMGTPAITHACEYETSMILALRPELVKLHLAKEAPTTLANDWWKNESGGRVTVFHRFHRMTAAGSMGKPTLATPEKGESMLNGVVNDTVSFLDDFRTWSDLPAIGPR